MSLRPGEEVHYIALLNEDGATMVVIPMREPLKCPDGARDVKVDVSLSLTLNGRGQR